MILLAAVFNAVLSAIPLAGVTGEELSARAYFDAHNVRVGDPMVLTIDFIGEAEFFDLHPPALSREVDRSVWKIDDASAKTETYRDARRLVYRVRPMKEGLLRFPSLEFTYEGTNGRGPLKVLTSAMPVHARAGDQAVLAGLEEADASSMPMPDGIIVDLGERELTDDELFAWRKACNSPSAKAFEEFAFPEGRLNEAACAIVEGNWARALRIYRTLEWRIGQTPSVERGIIAALARKLGDSGQDLPAWRQVARPWLRHAWGGRILLALAAVAVVSAVMWLSGRIIRALACVAVVLLALGAPFRAEAAGSLFDELERMMRQQEEHMNQMFNSMPGGMGGGSSFTINGMRQDPVKVTASAALSKDAITVGDPFEYILSLESPKTSTISDVQIDVSQKFGLTVLGPVENMTDAKSANPSNVIRRMSIPVRYDVPFTGDVIFTVRGMVGGRRDTGSGARRMTFNFSQNFAAQAAPLRVSVKPLPTDNQPEDFSGAIGSMFALRRSADRNRVSTNDVVTLRHTLEYVGYVPRGAVPDEISREEGNPTRANVLTWQSYFVADGSPEIPEESLCWYDATTKKYTRVTAPKMRLRYTAGDSDDAASSVAIDAKGEKPGAEGHKTVTLRFSPREDAPAVAVAMASDVVGTIPLEECRGWCRIEANGHIGWARKEELEAGDVRN